MKQPVIIALIGLAAAAGALVPSPGAAQPFNFWSRGIGGTSDEQTGAVAIDGDGNVYTTGSFRNTIDLGGGALVSAGERDVFLVKYAPDGSHEWSLRFGDASPDIANAIAVDTYGNVVIGGTFFGSINFGSGSVASAGMGDAFVAVFDTDGALLWDVTAGDTPADYVTAVAFDASSNVVATGGFNSTIDFGGGSLVSAGVTDAFLVQFDISGAHQWSQRFGGTSSDAGTELAVDVGDDIIFGGTFSNSVDFGGGVLVSAGQLDFVLARYDVSGGHQWSRSFGSTGTESMEGVSVGAAGDICITGSFTGTVDFGGGGLVSAGTSDIVLARYTAAGTHLWSHRFGGTSDDRGYALDRLASGDIVFTGRFLVSVDFGGGPRAALGAGDIFLAVFDTAGVYQTDEHWGSAGEENGRDVRADKAGGFVTTGYYATALNFGSGPLTLYGSYDIYLARFEYGSESPSITSIVDVGNDEGREVRITFGASVHDDAASLTQVTSYEVYRRDDAAPLVAVAAEGGTFRIPGWTYVTSAPAHAEASYDVLAATIGDSTVASGPYQSVFFIRAATAAPTVFYDSEPDSGYSLDNLAPPAPSSLVLAGAVLSWVDSPTPDLDYFSVYGGNSSDIESAVAIGQVVAPELNVAAAPYAYYFVTATDFAGNESSPGTTGTATGIGAAPAARELAVTAHPNPFNPNTTIAFTVPATGPVTLRVYDARGAHVATLVDGTAYVPGRHSVPWGGRNHAGQGVGSGVYFVRIDQGSVSRTHKIVLLK